MFWVIWCKESCSCVWCISTRKQFLENCNLAIQWNWLVPSFQIFFWPRNEQICSIPLFWKSNHEADVISTERVDQFALQAAEFFQNYKLFLTCLSKSICSFVQASWGSLRTEFSSLSPAQLHHMLTEYNPRRPCPSAWTPCGADADAACQTGEKSTQWHWYMIEILHCSSRSQISCQTDTGKIEAFSAWCHAFTDI